MNLELDKSLISHAKNNQFIKDFISELQNYCDLKTKKEEVAMEKPIHEEAKLTTKYRDEMLVQRNNTLKDYAQKTLEKGPMYYIYDKNFQNTESYNLCICEEGKSHIVIEESKFNLPYEAKIGSVLRKIGNKYIVDKDATEFISNQMLEINNKLIEEQKEYLEMQRIDGHIYEMAENDGEIALLFDITNDSSEGIEEIDFPPELLQDSQEGDLFIYKEGKYQKYPKTLAKVT